MPPGLCACRMCDTFESNHRSILTSDLLLSSSQINTYLHLQYQALCKSSLTVIACTGMSQFQFPTVLHNNTHHHLHTYLSWALSLSLSLSLSLCVWNTTCFHTNHMSSLPCAAMLSFICIWSVELSMKCDMSTYSLSRPHCPFPLTHSHQSRHIPPSSASDAVELSLEYYMSTYSLSRPHFPFPLTHSHQSPHKPPSSASGAVELSLKYDVSTDNSSDSPAPTQRKLRV